MQFVATERILPDKFYRQFQHMTFQSAERFWPHDIVKRSICSQNVCSSVRLSVTFVITERQYLGDVQVSLHYAVTEEDTR